MEEDSDEEERAKNEVGEWNWRDDDNFTHVMAQLHDIGSCIRQTSLRVKRHQELLSKGVIEGLEEYSNIVHTLPVMVKLHEDAMAVYNESKHKGSVSNKYMNEWEGNMGKYSAQGWQYWPAIYENMG